MQITAF